jgi:predicted acylesterase/phospholipase RssA
MRKIFVLGGGGVRGIYYLGACAKISDWMEADEIVGSSIGALMALCLLVKTPFNAMLDIFIRSSNYSSMIENNIDATLIDRKFGICRSVSRPLALKILKQANLAPDITLAGLREATGKLLTVATLCVSKNQHCYINATTHPDLPVQTAIEMSTAIPLLFEAVEWQGDFYVDNIIEIFPTGFAWTPEDVITAVRLRSDDRDDTTPGLPGFIKKLWRCVRREPSVGPNWRICEIATDCNPLDFGLTLKEKMEFVHMGAKAAEVWLQEQTPSSNLETNHDSSSPEIQPSLTEEQ